MASALSLLAKEGGADVGMLFAIAGPGFSTCLTRLRARGHRIIYDRQAKLYRLES